MKENKILGGRTTVIGMAVVGLGFAFAVAPPSAAAAKPAAAKLTAGTKPWDAYVKAGQALLGAPDAELPALDERLVAAGQALEASLAKELAAAEATKQWATSAGIRLQWAALAHEPPSGEHRKAAAFAVKRFLATVLVVAPEPAGVAAPRLDWKMQDVDLAIPTLEDALLWATEPATLSVSAVEPVGVSATTSTKSGSRIVDSGYVSNPALAAARSELSSVDQSLADVLRTIREVESGATTTRGASGSSYTYKEYNDKANSRSDPVNQGSTYKTTTSGSIYREARETRDHSADASLSELRRRRSDLEWRMQRLKDDIANLPATTRSIETVNFKEERQSWHGTVRRTWTLTLGKQAWTTVSQVDLSSYTYVRDAKPGWKTEAEMIDMARAELEGRSAAVMNELFRKATLQRLEARATASGNARRECDWGKYFAFGPGPEVGELLGLQSVDELRAARKAHPPGKAADAAAGSLRPGASAGGTGAPAASKANDWFLLGEAKRGCPAGMAWVAGGRRVAGEGNPAITVAGFCMDLTEVTADQYAAAAGLGKVTIDGLQCGPTATFGRADKADHPINCVSWPQAASYCEGVGKRLPTTAEWTWAARGQTNRFAFPWGDQLPTDQMLCWKRLPGDKGTCPVGTFPGGDSMHGIHDLAGNVCEWTSTAPSRTPGERTYCGGGWDDTVPGFIDPANLLNSGDDTMRRPTHGFRCVKKP